MAKIVSLLSLCLLPAALHAQACPFRKDVACGSEYRPDRAPAVQHRTRPALYTNSLSERTRAMLRATAAPASTPAAAKTTATKQRLVATGSIIGSGPFGSYDSTRYYYGSPVRGAAHDPRNPDSYSTYFDPTANIYISPVGNQRRLYMMPDSLVRTSASGGSTGQSRSHFTYNAADQPLTVEESYDTVTYQRYELSYDAAGRPQTSKVYFTFGPPGTPLVHYTTQYSFYNTAGRLTLDSIVNVSSGTPGPDEKYEYAYSSSGALTSITGYDWDGTAWEADERSLADYYPGSGLLRTVLYEVSDAGAWIPDYKDSVGYFAGTPVMLSYFLSSYYDSGAFVPEYRATLTLNSAGLYDVTTSEGYDAGAFLPQVRTQYTYNSAGNFDATYEYYDNDGDGAFDPDPLATMRYHYELYDDAVGIAGAPARPSAVLRLFPNPTGSTIEVRWEEGGGTPARYLLADAAGRTVETGTLSAAATRLTLDLSARPAGVYTLAVLDARGAVVGREKVVRR